MHLRIRLGRRLICTYLTEMPELFYLIKGSITEPAKHCWLTASEFNNAAYYGDVQVTSATTK